MAVTNTVTAAVLITVAAVAVNLSVWQELVASRRRTNPEEREPICMPTIETVSWQFGWSSLYPAAAARGLSPKAWVAFLPGGSRLMDARVPPLVAFCFFPEDKLGVVCNRSPKQVPPPAGGGCGPNCYFVFSCTWISNSGGCS